MKLAREGSGTLLVEANAYRHPNGRLYDGTIWNSGSGFGVLNLPELRVIVPHEPAGVYDSDGIYMADIGHAMTAGLITAPLIPQAIGAAHSTLATPQPAQADATC